MKEYLKNNIYWLLFINQFFIYKLEKKYNVSIYLAESTISSHMFLDIEFDFKESAWTKENFKLHIHSSNAINMLNDREYLISNIEHVVNDRINSRIETNKLYSKINGK